MLGLASTIQKTAEGYPQYRTRNSCTFTAGSEELITLGTPGSDFRVDGKDWAVSGWIKFTDDASSVANTDGNILLNAGSATAGIVINYLDLVGDDEKFTVVTADSGGADAHLDTTNLAHDTWYHFVATYDATETTSKVYVNGALSSTKTDLDAPAAYSGTVDIGSDSGDYISAIECELIFWKEILLSAAQIEGLYNNGRPRNGLSCERDKIIGYWRLNAVDDTGSNNVIDYSGNGHHGTTSNLSSGDFDTTDVPK